MFTIVYANPSKAGFNGAILAAIEKHLIESKKEYFLIDLYEDGFNPAFTAEERDIYFTGTGISPDPLVQKYQTILKQTNHVLFIFPIWWMSCPAILKGFFERTCLPNFSYEFTNTGGIEPLLNNITEYTVLTMSGGVPKEALIDTIDDQFNKRMLSALTKSADITWLHATAQMVATPENMEKHISEIKKVLTRASIK